MRKVLLVTTWLMAGLAVAAPVVAQPGATPAKPAADGSMAARVDQRIAQMHRRLNITAEQEPAWDAFAQAMRGNATSTEQAYRERGSAVESMTAPENLHNFAQIEQARAQGVQTLAASFDSLYGALSNDQRKIADAMFRHFEDKGPGQRHGGKKPG